MVRAIFWILIIPGAIITYFILGTLFNILLCISGGEDWKREIRKDDTIPLIIFWPFVLLVYIIVAPVCALQWVLGKITGEDDDD